MKKSIIEIPLIFLTIENDGFHLMIHGKINEVDANFLIDTGASRTVFDSETIIKFVQTPEFTKKEGLSAGLGATDITSHELIIPSIEFSELRIENYKAVSVDLQNIIQSYQKMGLPHIDCILGSDVLVKYQAVINLKTKKLKMYF